MPPLKRQQNISVSLKSMEERQRVSEKLRLCQWDIKRAKSAVQTKREKGRETRRMTEIQEEFREAQNIRES